MISRTLLLNSTYEVISFLHEKKVFKLIVKDKVDIISNWDDIVKCGSKEFHYPSVLKLKQMVRINAHYISFSRQAIVKRDRHVCQYCSKKLKPSEITIDHVVPRCRGGGNSFTNCVVSCLPCNNKKGDKLLEESGLQLIMRPVPPSFERDIYFPYSAEFWHKDWDIFLGKSAV